MILAYILIIVGILFFLKNTGIVMLSWSVIWPLLLIGLGVYIGLTSRRLSEWWRKIWEKISKKLE